MNPSSSIRVGVGGWTYEPWRDNFFPKGLPQSRELGYAAERLTTIEINATYYRTQQRASFAKWRDATPSGFVFAVKALRYVTTARVLADAGASIERFIGSGVGELGEKLGPIVWQFMPTRRFDAEDFAAFLALLPAEVEGVPLRHAVEARHPSFMCPEYLQLARRHRVATVFADSAEHPCFADLTADFVYARLMRTEAQNPLGYEPAALDRWAERARAWSRGEEPADLPRCEPPSADAPSASRRDVFAFFISGAKERAPAAAMALLERLRAQDTATAAGA